MAKQYRSRKKNGKTYRYPISPGMSKKAAYMVGDQLRKEYPDEFVRVLKVNKQGGANAKYAPFISYLFESIKNWLPVEEDYGIGNAIPEVTGRVLSGISGSNPYYVYMDPAQESVLVFGRTGSNEMSYIIDWPKVYPSDGKEGIVMVTGTEKKELKKEFQLNAMRTRIKDEINGVRARQETSTIVTDFQASQIYDLVSRFPPDTTFEVQRTEDSITVFPMAGSGDIITFNVGESDQPGKATSFFTGSALHELMEAFQASGSPNMLIELNSRNEPLYTQFFLYDRKGYYYANDKNAVKSAGTFSAIINPAEYDAEAAIGANIY